MNSSLNKIIVADIDKQWTKEAKEMVVDYTNKYLVELMDWLFMLYGHITPGDLMLNQEEMQVM